MLIKIIIKQNQFARDISAVSQSISHQLLSEREILGFIVITILLHFIHLTLYDSFYKCTCVILLHDLTWLDLILVLMFISQLIIIWATTAADEIYRWMTMIMCVSGLVGAHTTQHTVNPIQCSTVTAQIRPNRDSHEKRARHFQCMHCSSNWDAIAVTAAVPYNKIFLE